MKIKYGHNNSGGRDWLTEQNWKDLESNGWELTRYEKDFLFGAGRAYQASKDFELPVQAMKEFEGITGADVTDEGCNCCGAPHSFSWTLKDGKFEYVSGEDCIPHLFGSNVPKTLREAIEAKK